MLLLLLGVQLLAGCANTALSDQPPEIPGAVAGDTGAKQTMPEPSPSVTGSEPLLVELYNQALAAQTAGQWQEAIERSERALRINRRQPRFYLLLAESYWQLGKRDLAANFAKQGLRYLSSESKSLRQRLEELAHP